MMRTIALPGVGAGVGRVWIVGGSDVEVTTRARWDWGRDGGVDIVDLVMEDGVLF